MSDSVAIFPSDRLPNGQKHGCHETNSMLLRRRASRHLPAFRTSCSTSPYFIAALLRRDKPSPHRDGAPGLPHHPPSLFVAGDHQFMVEVKLCPWDGEHYATNAQSTSVTHTLSSPPSAPPAPLPPPCSLPLSPKWYMSLCLVEQNGPSRQSWQVPVS